MDEYGKKAYHPVWERTASPAGWRTTPLLFPPARSNCFSARAACCMKEAPVAIDGILYSGIGIIVCIYAIYLMCRKRR